jgi:hypothetical protein
VPLSVLLALGAVGLFLYLRGRAAEAAAHRLADPDAAPLEELRRAGSDLRQPHDMEFFFYLRSEPAAGRIASALRRRGFASEVSRSDGSDDWLCRATGTMLPALERLRDLRREFTALTEPEDGVYDGWGTTVIPRGSRR